MDQTEGPSDVSFRKRGPGDSDKQTVWVELTGKYLDDLPRQLGEIASLLAAEDYAGISHHAHRAKGTSATYRLASISEGFAQLEERAQSQDSQAIEGTVDRIMRMVQLEAGKLASAHKPSRDNLEMDADE
ncbi:MAG: Hpt domain-containing protein [Planctomycetota bacterium]|jgi:HPt (histidine-containing phosphotransfer) domain-containing protein